MSLLNELKHRNVERSHSVTTQTGKKLDRWVIIILVVVLTYFVFDKFVLDPARDAQIAETSAQKGRSEVLVDIFAIQDEISAAIVGSLREKLGLEDVVAPQVTAITN